ncbi:CatB-related O-acetyltransferase [Flavobacterium sp. RSP29]|uniref:CatB-related O-acetyltransferase n=1 Tax=Flavobacterium sp. RSP29 TaxID=3401731 RepID=UPI003AADA4AF
MREFLKKTIRKMLGIEANSLAGSIYMRENPQYTKYSIGIGTYGTPYIYDWSQKTSLTIGNYCSIGGNVSILLGGEHQTDWVTTYPFSGLNKDMITVKNDNKSKGDVLIGSDVWIGNNVTILSGVTIGNGVVIGAGSIVTKNIPDYAIVGGNPAKIIRYRFDSEKINKLKEIAWWDWDIEEIKNKKLLILSNDIDTFIAESTPPPPPLK